MIVVAAGIIRHGAHILLARRKPGGEQGLLWEFPGGKLEPGEQPEQALVRELREELGVETEVTGYVASRRFLSGERDLLLLFYEARLLSGTPDTLDCTAVEWVLPEHIPDYALAPADRSVAETCLAEAR